MGRSLFAKHAAGTTKAEFPQLIQTMLPPQQQLALIPVLSYYGTEILSSNNETLCQRNHRLNRLLTFSASTQSSFARRLLQLYNLDDAVGKESIFAIPVRLIPKRLGNRLSFPMISHSSPKHR